MSKMRKKGTHTFSLMEQIATYLQEITITPYGFDLRYSKVMFDYLNSCSNYKETEKTPQFSFQSNIRNA